MSDTTLSGAENFWVFVGLLVGVGLLDLLAFVSIIVLALLGDTPHRANTRENLWRLVFALSTALLGLVGGKQLGG